MDVLDTQDTELMVSLLRGGHYVQNRMYGKGPHRILFLLLRHGNMTQRELLNFRGIRSASLSEMLSKMESYGLIEREKCEADKRNVQIKLTEKGETEARIFAKERQDTAKSLFSVLSQSEKQSMEKIFNKLLSQWDQETPQ